MWKTKASARQSKSHKPIPSHIPSDRPSENRGDFRQENGTVAERLDTVTQNSRQALVTKILFSSRDYPSGVEYPDPLYDPVAFAYFVFSHSAIPKREIRAENRLIGGANSGEILVKKQESPRRRHHRQKEWSDSLDENRSAVHAPIFFFSCCQRHNICCCTAKNHWHTDISCIVFYPFNVHLKLRGFVP